MTSFRLPAVGPAGSVLQQLLQEINDRDVDSSSSDARLPFHDGANSRRGSLTSSGKGSMASSIHSSHQNSSVWVKGGSVAEDARQKLRALDEARQRKRSVDTCHWGNLQAFDGPTHAPEVAPDLPSPPMFSGVHFGRAATFSIPKKPSPFPDDSKEHFRGKRERSGADSPELLTKKIRNDSLFDKPYQDRQYCTPSTPPCQTGRCGGTVATTHVRSPSLLGLCLDSSAEMPPSPPSGLRVTPKHANKPPQPATPRRSPTSEHDNGSPGGTPAWMRPLHLVDDDVSIYKNVHGEKSQDRPLCLFCFRQHGNFHRILQHGCEVCGQEEVLEGHYWEAPFWAR
ncbi:hypothetical protein N0V90_004292 [Kalmusia sp. IMI 367209]|nr:hypothetical protein N0V90_004292 [Kalmusia sp. IMI 367209]